MIRRLANRHPEELQFLPVQERLTDPKLRLDRFFKVRALRIVLDHHAVRGCGFHEIAMLLLENRKTPRGTGSERVVRMFPHHEAISLDRVLPVTRVLSRFGFLE